MRANSFCKRHPQQSKTKPVVYMSPLTLVSEVAMESGANLSKWNENSKEV